MNKRIVFIFILFLFFLQLISSLELGLSPAYLNLETKVGEQVCQNTTIYADKSIDITIKDRWTEVEKSRNLRDYNLSREDMNIKSVFPGKISVSANKKKEVEVCFLPEKAGRFYGAVLFESENGYASVGSWIELNVTEKKGIISLTGKMIGTGENMSYILTGINFVLGIVLLFLLLRLKKKRELA